MKSLEKLETLLIGENGLLIKLRLGDGLDQDTVNDILITLSELSNEWSHLDLIPKKSIELFIDIYPTMESSLELYSSDDKIKIMDVADKIINSVKDCVIN